VSSRAQRATAVLLAKPPYASPPISPVSIADGAFVGQNARIFGVSTPTLETFPNPRPERDYEIRIECPEFTSVCPKTGLPDFGEIHITYVPAARCVELKSLKYYMIGFRNRGIFYEHVTNEILDDLVTVLQPRKMTVVDDFSVRGGIKTSVTATYVAPP
jgi:7-cyano-7-deazaguanine reductase